MKLSRLAILILVLSGIIFSQHNSAISGQVIDKESGLPVIGVNIYLSETTIGTTTDKHGNFKIKKIPAGEYLIVCSMIGYKTFVKKVYVEPKTEAAFLFKLEEKIYETDEVLVVGKEDEEWQEHFEEFRGIFLGITDFSENCKILNKEVIEFKYAEDVLSGYTTEPIIVENLSLGYKIHCNMDDFYYDPDEGKFWFDYTCKFFELKSQNEEIKETWEENRKFNFETSMQHALQWLMNKDRDKSFYYIGYTNLKGRYRNLYNSDRVNNISFVKEYYKTGFLNLNFQNGMNFENMKYDCVSVLELLQGYVPVDSLGFVKSKHAVVVYGYWAKVGLANALPKNYYKTNKI